MLHATTGMSMNTVILNEKKKKKQVKQKEKGAAEDEMVIEHHWLNGRESEQTPGDSEGQSRLVG